MAEIVVTDEQAKIIATSADEVLVRDVDGNVLACIPARLSSEEAEIVKEAKRRLSSNQQRYPTDQVLERLSSLEQ